MKRILGLSGGSTKGIGQIGVLEELTSAGIYWDDIVGVSIGALIAPCVALGLLEPAKESFLSLKIEDFFEPAPLKKDGGFSMKSLWFLLKNKVALGDMRKSMDIVRGIITEKHYKEYLAGDYPECYVVSVNFSNGSQNLMRLKSAINYNIFLEMILASASIPVFTMPVRLGWHYYYDGGVRDHVATHKMLSKKLYDECYTIFTRPANYALNNRSWEPKGILSVLSRTIDIMNMEISKNDEQTIDMLCEKQCIPNHKIFLPSVMESLYDTDSKRLNILYEEGKRIGRNFVKSIKNNGTSV